MFCQPMHIHIAAVICHLSMVTCLWLPNLNMLQFFGSVYRCSSYIYTALGCQRRIKLNYIYCVLYVQPFHALLLHSSYRSAKSNFGLDWTILGAPKHIPCFMCRQHAVAFLQQFVAVRKLIKYIPYTCPHICIICIACTAYMFILLAECSVQIIQMSPHCQPVLFFCIL